MNDIRLNQRRMRPDFTSQNFYSDEPLPINLQVPAFLKLHGTLELWDPAPPKRGLPPLLETYFEKACGAPIAEERLKEAHHKMS